MSAMACRPRHDVGRPGHGALVREAVRSILLSADSFAQLPDTERRELARAMVNVGQYLVDAGGATRDLP